MRDKLRNGVSVTSAASHRVQDKCGNRRRNSAKACASALGPRKHLVDLRQVHRRSTPWLRLCFSVRTCFLACNKLCKFIARIFARDRHSIAPAARPTAHNCCETPTCRSCDPFGTAAISRRPRRYSRRATSTTPPSGSMFREQHGLSIRYPSVTAATRGVT